MLKKEHKLSVVLAVHNEGNNIGKCLSSVKNIADEIVVVDGKSTDNTIEVAKSHGARVIVTTNPPIFHINKQKAVDEATCEWVLQLDADEIVTEELASEIIKTIHLKDAKEGYYIARKNYFINQWMKKGGMYPDYVIRLFKRQNGKFPCKSVHEQIAIDGQVGYLENPMVHMPYPTFNEYLRKADTYTSLTRDELVKQKLRVDFMSMVKYFFYYPARTFVSLFIRHAGFEDGWWGFVWSLFSGLHYPWAYVKYLQYKSHTT